MSTIDDVRALCRPREGCSNHSVPAGGGVIDTKWSDANVVRDALRRQAQANREQAVANRATAQAILAHAQRLGYNDTTTDIEPDSVPGCRCTCWRQGAGSIATGFLPERRGRGAFLMATLWMPPPSMEIPPSRSELLVLPPPLTIPPGIPAKRAPDVR